MKEHTDIQIIKGPGGKPAFVVIPYEQYTSLIQRPAIDLENAVPAEVVDLVFDKGYSPARAWREYLDKTQEEVAQAMGITQAAYSAHERSGRLRKATRQKIADALGIAFEQINI